MKSHTVHFDTLEYKNDLVEAGMSEMEAEAITKANAKVFNHILENQGEITKGDFREAEINMRSDVNERIHVINLKIEELKYELKNDIYSLNLKIEETRSELKEDIHKIDLKIEQTKSDLIKYTNDCTWKVIALLGGVIVIATTASTLAQHFWK